MSSFSFTWSELVSVNLSCSQNWKYIARLLSCFLAFLIVVCCTVFICRQCCVFTMYTQTLCSFNLEIDVFVTKQLAVCRQCHNRSRLLLPLSLYYNALLRAEVLNVTFVLNGVSAAVHIKYFLIKSIMLWHIVLVFTICTIWRQVSWCL